MSKTSGAGLGMLRSNEAPPTSNEKIVPVEEASVPLLDWGFLRSDACQETISVWNGQFFRLDDHLQRFERSVTRLRMTSSPVSRDEIRSIAHPLVAACGYDKA